MRDEGGRMKGEGGRMRGEGGRMRDQPKREPAPSKGEGYLSVGAPDWVWPPARR
jgi:hypothetical protein